MEQVLLKISLMYPLSDATAPIFLKYETGFNTCYNHFTFLGKVLRYNYSGSIAVAPIENEINPSREDRWVVLDVKRCEKPWFEQIYLT